MGVSYIMCGSNYNVKVAQLILRIIPSNKLLQILMWNCTSYLHVLIMLTTLTAIPIYIMWPAGSYVLAEKKGHILLTYNRN